jgi:hypothetical protein
MSLWKTSLHSWLVNGIAIVSLVDLRTVHLPRIRILYPSRIDCEDPFYLDTLCIPGPMLDEEAYVLQIARAHVGRRSIPGARRSTKHSLYWVLAL